MPSFGFGEVPAGSDVTHLVRTLEAVRRNPASLQAIEEATTSCVQWGGVLQQLIPDAQPFFVRKPNINIGPEDFNRIAEELRKGNAVLVSVKFPGSTNHVFAIEARENGTARILHAWQGKHQLRVERTMPVDEMVGYLVTFRPIFSFPGAFVSLFFIRPFEWHPFQRRNAKVTYILQVVSCKCMSYLRFISQSVSLLECTFVML